MVAPLGSMTWHLLTQVGCSGLFSTLQGDQAGHFEASRPFLLLGQSEIKIFGEAKTKLKASVRQIKEASALNFCGSK